MVRPDDPSTRVIDELGIDHGSARVDVAVVNGIMHGYEIKSDRDTLARLPLQIPAYSAVLDRVTLVAGERHVRAAGQCIPDWWGLKAATVGPRGAIHFQTIRRARENPAVQPLAIARLLWRDEAVALLEILGAARGWVAKPRAELYARLAQIAPLCLLQEYVRNRLRDRTGWRFGQPQT